MNNLVNLKQVRKTKERQEKRQQGDENAAKHGVPKSERVLQATRSEKAARMLDQHELDPET